MMASPAGVTRISATELATGNDVDQRDVDGRGEEYEH